MPNSPHTSLDRNVWFEAAFESLPVATLLIDKDALIDTLNERACILIGVPCSMIKGKPLNEVIGILDAKSGKTSRLQLEQVMQLGLTLTVDNVIFKGDLSPKGSPLSVIAVPISNGNRDVLGAVVTLSVSQTASRIAPSQDVALETLPQHKQSLYVRSAGRYVRVLLSELLWVEAMENYVLLQTQKDKIIVHATLKTMVDALSHNGFKRIHRSFIVKMDEIERIEENHVVVTGISIPIGKSYRAELLENLTLI